MLLQDYVDYHQDIFEHYHTEIHMFQVDLILIDQSFYFNLNDKKKILAFDDIRQ